MTIHMNTILIVNTVDLFTIYQFVNSVINGCNYKAIQVIKISSLKLSTALFISCQKRDQSTACG